MYVYMVVSICGHAQELGITDTCITQGWGGERLFLAMEDKEDRGDWAIATYVFSGVKCRNECSMQPTASDSDKKSKRSVHCRSQVGKKRVQSRKHVLESLHKPGIVLLAPTEPAVRNFGHLPACTMHI